MLGMNGVMAFREDTRKNAKITLTIIIVLLTILLIGIALLCRAYGIGATEPGSANYESVLSMLTRAVVGHGTRAISRGMSAFSSAIP